jgi:tetratricopeptide (TPR) repeat protein
LYEVFDCDEEGLKQLKLQTAPLFQQGLLLYKKGDFAQAEAVFQQCLALCPEDKLLAVYLTRCNVLQRIPAGNEWEGVSGI